MQTSTKILLVSAILFLSLLSTTIFFYIKSLLTKYSEQPLETIEKRIKGCMYRIVGILVTMIAVTVIVIKLS